MVVNLILVVLVLICAVLTWNIRELRQRITALERREWFGTILEKSAERRGWKL
jgi:hypothetical protein